MPFWCCCRSASELRRSGAGSRYARARSSPSARISVSIHEPMGLAIRLPARELARYGRAMRGAGFAVPDLVARWRPPPAARRELRQLHQSAMRAAETRSGMLIDGEAAHGLEQQLIHAPVDCLSTALLDDDKSAQRHRDVLARFEDLLQMQPFLSVAEISAALGVSAPMLRKGCRGAFGDEPEQLPSPSPDATGASRAAQRKSRRCECGGDCTSVRSARSRPFRRQLSSPLWRIAVRHFAAVR